MANDKYRYEIPEFCLGEAFAEISRRGGLITNLSDVNDGIAVLDAEIDAEAEKGYEAWLAELIAKGRQGRPPYCSFCGKGKNEVERMLAGPGASVHICNECVLVCQEMIEKGEE